MSWLPERLRLSFAQLPQSLLLVLLATLPYHIPDVSALQGDSWCGTLMCVNATVNASTVTYELKSLNQLGWMAIGFGSHMADTPMVIVWQAPDGSTILSQRQASGRVEPQPVTDPPRLASTSHRVNPSSNVSSILAFDMPRANDTVQSLIWAFGITTPDASPTARIEQHLDAGTLSLNLTKELVIASGVPSSSATSPSSSAGSRTATTGSPTPSASAARTSRPSGLLVAHAVLSAAGFLIVLPLGTLLARWSRVYTPKWFTAHWFVNVVLGIPLICLGWALGPLAVAQQSGEHVVTAHQICGVVLFVLYIVEVALGTLVHLRRPKQGASHPPRNVIHVVVGLVVFGLSVYETINGASRDPSVTGASQSVVAAICIGWAAVFAGTYSVGLLFLRRQFAQERLGWNVPSSVPMPLPAMGVAPAGTRASSGSESVRRRPRMAALDSPMADDGTHDVFSEPWAIRGGAVSEAPSGGGEGEGEARGPARERTEMRQVATGPVSLLAFL